MLGQLYVRMKKLIQGIIDFRMRKHPGYKETFAKLALGQQPDVLFVACSDSRVAVNVFASTEPGDLFVVRNVGNMIPPSGMLGMSIGDESELAALEFALLNLGVKHIIVCGHSECGAMIAIYNGRDKVEAPHLRSWLAHGQSSLDLLEACKGEPSKIAPHNRLSQLNVLQQLEHLKTYPIVTERMKSGQLRLHGWWFDIAEAEVYFYSEKEDRFLVFTEESLQLMLS